jgi:hypothetical protein
VRLIRFLECVELSRAAVLSFAMKLPILAFTAALDLMTMGAAGARDASTCLPPSSPLPSAPGAEAQSVSFSGPVSAELVVCGNLLARALARRNRTHRRCTCG